MKALHVLVLVGLSAGSFAQGFTRKTWHDPEKRNIKEVFLVKGTIAM
ncbi:hypothetical protein QQ054_36790 [Oscillatoria amoena NRMC-F 0135]|nr:hypothetical protein [Oscillatoria amoena NRMC-F 0135]